MGLVDDILASLIERSFASRHSHRSDERAAHRLLFLVVHFLEANAITPLLEWKIVRLPPALTMTAQLWLAVIAGPLAWHSQHRWQW